MKRYRVSVQLPYTYALELDATSPKHAIQLAKAADPDAFCGARRIKVVEVAGNEQ